MRTLFVSRHEGKEINEPLGTQCLVRYVNQELKGLVSVEHSFDNLPDGEYEHVYISGCNNLGKIVEAYNKYTGAADLIMIGGSYATSYYSNVLKDCPKAICVIGEGEIAAYSIIKSTIDGTSLESVPNIAFMRNEELIQTPRKILDLGCIKHELDHEFLDQITRGVGLVRMETSRGCDHNKCTFCTIPQKYNGEKRRDFPIEIVRKEVIHLSSRGVKSICFTDEEFIGKDLRRAEGIVRMIDELKANGLICKDMKFMASVSVKLIKGKSKEHFETAKTLLRSMKKAGFDMLFVGIESGSKTQLKRYGKGVTPEDNEDVLDFLKATDICADIGFIMFDPLMSFSELEENIEFVVRNGIHKTAARVIKKMIMIPGTAYEKMVRKKHGFLDEYGIAESSTEIYIDPMVRAVLERISIDELSCDDSYIIQSRKRMGLEDSSDDEKIKKYREEEMQKLVEAVESVKFKENTFSKTLEYYPIEELNNTNCKHFVNSNTYLKRGAIYE
jgi:radical SAM superfamily enzyme YgiQ (UPF0313 family)